MIQDNNLCVTLRSNDSRYLFLTNFKSSYCVALPRQICLKDGKNWEVGYHDTFNHISVDIVDIPGGFKSFSGLLVTLNSLPCPRASIKNETSLDVIVKESYIF